LSEKRNQKKKKEDCKEKKEGHFDARRKKRRSRGGRRCPVEKWGTPAKKKGSKGKKKEKLPTFLSKRKKIGEKACAPDHKKGKKRNEFKTKGRGEKGGRDLKKKGRLGGCPLLPCQGKRKQRKLTGGETAAENRGLSQREDYPVTKGK